MGRTPDSTGGAGPAGRSTDPPEAGTSVRGAVRLPESALLEALFAASPAGMAVIGTDLRFVRINERLAQINGASIEAHLGRTVAEMAPGLDGRREAALRRVIETGEPLRDVEIVGETPAQPGVRRTWIEQFVPMRDDAGRMVGVGVVSEDVSGQRAVRAARDAAVDELRGSEERLALALEAGQLGVWDRHVPSGRMVFGGQWASMLGYAPHEVGPQVDGWTSAVHPDDLPAVTALLGAHLEGRTPFYECEHRVRSRTGQWLWVLDRGRVVERDEHGRAIRAVGTRIDVTERRLAIDALHEADRRKDEFLATLGHELRNPLAPLANALRLTSADPSIQGTSRQALDIAARQLRHLRRLVDDLLDVSGITFRRIELDLEPLSIATVLQGAADSVAATLARRRQVLEAIPADPGLRVLADPVRLAQILDNLLGNASKYTPEGGRIVLSARDVGSLVEIRVTDTGIGIDPADLETVFELFVQVHADPGRAGGGLGIGLALVRRLVELHRGSVFAHSEGAGRGTTLVVQLPRP
jgi:PAS domain S-box-containing protein